MIIEFYHSLKDNFRQRTTNPLLGTLIIVWIVKNWILVYTIFNFDEGTKLNQKLEAINKYLLNYDAIGNFLVCVSISLAIVFVTYFFINLSRLIINFYANVVEPRMYKWTDISSIVLKSDYNKLYEAHKKLSSMLDQERETRIKAQEDFDSVEKRNGELLIELDKYRNIEVKETSENIAVLDILEITYKKLQETNLLEYFVKCYTSAMNEEPLDQKDQNLRKFVTMQLLKKGKYYSGDLYYYGVDTLGYRVYDKYTRDEGKS